MTATTLAGFLSAISVMARLQFSSVPREMPGHADGECDECLAELEGFDRAA